MTSANVIDYTIFDKTGKKVGSHSQHCYCITKWEKLMKFLPLNEHTIQASGEDEHENYWEDEPVNLFEFLSKIAHSKHYEKYPSEFSRQFKEIYG